MWQTKLHCKACMKQYCPSKKCNLTALKCHTSILKFYNGTVHATYRSCRIEKTSELHDAHWRFYF